MISELQTFQAYEHPCFPGGGGGGGVRNSDVLLYILYVCCFCPLPLNDSYK